MTKWWQSQIAYQIYPRSFYDSNNDGIGDIPGIIAKLDYLEVLGVTILWLCPVFDSPQKDYGYDVADYRNIDPMYGTLEDMDTLIQEAAKRGIRILMDLVMNHTSDQHEWFKKSRARVEPYTDYYIWQDGKGFDYPNNWTSIFTGPAWTYDEVRKQYYLHLFAKEQPDLNFHNPKVIEEIKDIMRFWLDRGIYGFRYDAINVIYKSSLEDGEASHLMKGQEHYLAQEGNHKILQALHRDVLSHYDTFTVGEADALSPEEARRFCDLDRNEIDVLFRFDHIHTNTKFRWIKTRFKPRKFFQAMADLQNQLHWNTLFFENHDLVRSVSQFGNDKDYWYESATALATLMLTLKGMPFIYQGQEIGMKNFDYSGIEETQDIESQRLDNMMKQKLHLPKWLRWHLIKKVSRDNSRTPMQWDDTVHAGFSNAMPWLRVPKHKQAINVAKQFNDANSILSFYRNMISFRQQNNLLLEGDFQPLSIGKHVFVYRRGSEKMNYTILVNLSRYRRKTKYLGEIVFGNYGIREFDGILRPYEAVILK